MPVQATDFDTKSTGPRSLTRVLGLFESLAKCGDGLSLAELNVALDSPKSSLLNLLRPLVNEGFLIHHHGRYRLGPAIFRLSASIMSAWSFSRVFHPYVEELANRIHETVYLGILDKDQKVITYVDVIESTQSVRYAIPIGMTRPLYCTAAGRVLLAHAEKSWLEKYLRTTKLEPRTEQTVTSKKALRVLLDRIRAEGVSISIGEFLAESAGIAAPVFGADGKVVAGLAVGAPTDRFEKQLPQMRVALLEVTRRASGVAPAMAA